MKISQLFTTKALYYSYYYSGSLLLILPADDGGVGTCWARAALPEVVLYDKDGGIVDTNCRAVEERRHNPQMREARAVKLAA